MKTNILKNSAFVIALFISSVANAAVTLPLDYTNFFAAGAINSGGTTLETGNANTVGTWTVGTAGSASNPTVSNNNLSYSTYIDNNAGKKISLPSLASGTARTSFFYITSSAADLTANTYYLGFLINTSATPSSGVIFLNFGDGTPGTQRGRILIKQNTGNTGYLIQASVDGTPTATTNTISYNSTHFIVLKYQISTASSTVGVANMTLFVDPTIGDAEPVSTFTISDTGITSLTCIKSLTVSQQIGLAADIAGVRFSTSWADVCKASGAPKLTTPTATAATNVSSNGFTANWNTVSSAQSYTLTVTQNGAQITGSPFTGLSGTTYSVSGLNSLLTYSYTVTAIGDGTTNSNSDASSAQSATTLDPNAVNTITANFADGSWSALISSYSDVSTNGFDFAKANLGSVTYYGSKGESHAKNVGLDNKINGGKMTFPTVNSLEQIEIHALTGTAERTFDLKELNKLTGSYDLVATYTYNTASKTQNLDSVYLINISRTSPAKFRIENSGFGGMNVMQVITRSTALSSLAQPAITGASNVTTTGFTANWTPVNNATGYKVLVFGHGSIGQTMKYLKSTVVNNQLTSNCSFTGLDSVTVASYRVTAIADGTTAIDSYLSSSSAAFVISNTTKLDKLSYENLIFANRTIIAPEAGNFEVYNLQGMRILNVLNKKQLDLPFAKGIYLVKFTSASATSVTQKIVLE